MANKITDIAVFISCPGNLNELRGVAEKAIEEVSETLKVTHSYVLTPISWKEDIVPGVGTDGQDVINSQTIGKYDIYLGIMGAKFGTKTPRAGSGTEEEFDLAIHAYHKDPTKIRILFYLQAFGVNPFEIDPDELKKVQQFQKKLQKEGILYNELPNLDEALKNLKAHLLLLVNDEWDDAMTCWKTPISAHVSQVAQVMTHSSDVSSETTVDNPLLVPNDDSIEQLGLLDFMLIGNQEVVTASASVAKIGSNLEELTKATQERVASIGGGNITNAADMARLVNIYSSDIDAFLQKSRGEMANAKYHLFRGCELIEAYYRQTTELNLPTSEAASGVIVAVDGIEPELKRFRNSVLEAKNGVGKLPPMTKKFKVSQRRLVDYFDEVSVDTTVFIERFALLKSRLGSVSDGTVQKVGLSQGSITIEG